MEFHMPISKEEYVRAEEEDDNGRPIDQNHAFGDILNTGNWEFHKGLIENVEVFKDLYWCPNSGKEPDYIDKMNPTTRQMGPITLAIKADSSSANSEFFNQNESRKPKRLFTIEYEGKRYILDGLHRAGRIAYLLANGKPFDPFTLYIAKRTDS